MRPFNLISAPFEQLRIVCIAQSPPNKRLPSILFLGGSHRKVCERPLRQLRLSWSPLTSRHADRHIDLFLSQRPLQPQLKQKSDKRSELVWRQANSPLF
jgi:hypothetical protein